MSVDLDNIYLIQLCSCCGAHSKAAKHHNEITDAGWITEINFALCPDCKIALFDLIRSKRIAGSL